jgi:NADP-dependent 3-hydroxy acid dehydrogenase YdfG
MSVPPFPTFVPTWHTASYDGIDPRQNPKISVSGKTVVVTGGGRGIGARIASSFAAAGAANVVLIGRAVSQLERQKTVMTKTFPNTKTHIFSADIAETDAIENIFAQVAATVAPVDILVSNAGYLSEPASILSADIKDWWKGFETNVLGAVNVVRGFLNHASATPILISVSTCITHIPAIPGLSGYGASKEAFLRVLDFVAAENPSLRIMNVHPGVLETDMHAKSGNVDMKTDDSKFRTKSLSFN